MAQAKAIEFIHGDLYGTALAVTKKWVARSEMRPVLNYVRHQINGSMVATDSHRLIEIRNMHGFGDEILINPKTFVAAEGTFPDTSKLSTLEGSKAVIVLTKDQIKLWLQLFKSINQTMKVMKLSRNKHVTFEFSEKETHVDVALPTDGVKFSLPGIIDKPAFDKIAVSSEYIRDAMEAHFKMQSEQLTIYMSSPMKPIIMDDDNHVRTLILPVRVY